MIQNLWENKTMYREFPGPVVRLRAFTAVGLGLIPAQGTKILQAMQCGDQKKKKKPMEFNKSSSKREVHRGANLPQETRKISNNLNLHTKEVEKRTKSVEGKKL